MERKIRIGHTGITWPSSDIDDAIRTIGALGYHGIELFGHDIERREREGTSVRPLLEAASLPYVASYCSAALIGDSVAAGRENCARWAALTRSYGGHVIVLGGDSVDRAAFDFSTHKDRIIASINAIGRLVTDAGLLCCFHPHTGTPVETEDEIRAVMDAVDTDVVKFAPDIGQIAKGGTDPASIVSDYIDLVQHVHLKDYVGGQVAHRPDGTDVDRTGFLDYQIIGQGVIEIASMMQLLESAGFSGFAMVELDGTHFSADWNDPPPVSPSDAARMARDHLAGLGYSFRA